MSLKKQTVIYYISGARKFVSGLAGFRFKGGF